MNCTSNDPIGNVKWMGRICPQVICVTNYKKDFLGKYAIMFGLRMWSTKPWKIF